MYIKQLYEDGVSKSEIQRRTKLNYRTVSKYAEALNIDGKPLPKPVQAMGAVFSAKRALSKILIPAAGVPYGLLCFLKTARSWNAASHGHF